MKTNLPTLSRASRRAATALSVALAALLALAPEALAETPRVDRDAIHSVRPAPEAEASPMATRTVRKTRVKRTRRTTRRTYRSTRYVGPTTYIVHHHGHRDDQPTEVVTRRRRNDGGPYLGLGVGVVGIDNDVSGDRGSGVSLAVGARSGRFALELSVLGAAQPVQVDRDVVHDISLGGLAADLKLYIPVDNTIEPYVQGGMGYYAVGSSLQPEDEPSVLHPALNLGGGLDLRLNRAMAVGGRYLYHSFMLESPESDFGQTSSSWSAMGTLTVYF